MADLENLQWLSLGDNQLSGEIPQELGSLENLVGLVLHGNQLSGCVPASLEDQLGVAELGSLEFCP